MCLNVCIYLLQYMYINSIIVCYLFNFIVIIPSPSVAPANFRGISVTQTNITFSWNTLNYQEANGIVRWYIITCTETISATVVRIALP